MAHVSTALDPRGYEFTSTEARPQRGLLRRVAEAIMAARMRQADREVARFISASGGKFTDEVEREIERRFLSNQSHW
jgi:hypothetical protein